MNLIDAVVIPDSDRHSQWPFAAKSAMLSPLSVSQVCVGSVSGRCGCLGVPVRVLSLPECVPKSR